MTHKEICKHLSQDDDEYIFLSGVCDKVDACRNKNIIASTKFLDAHKLALTKQLFANIPCNPVFDGGADDAERVVCVLMPDYPSNHNLFRFIRAEKSKQDTLTHRDYLGSLMGLGVNRDCVGDIYVHEGGADIVVLSEIADFLMLEYKKAGRKQLSLSYISGYEMITGAGTFTMINITVPSMRLGAVAGAVFKLSRSDSMELIKNGRIMLNSAERLKPDKNVSPGDRTTVRGKGRAEIASITSKTKKDRIKAEIKMFGKI